MLINRMVPKAVYKRIPKSLPIEEQYIYSLPLHSALSFDGIDDYVNLSRGGMPYGASARSFLFWLKPAVAQTKNAIGYGTASNGQMFDILMLENPQIIGINWYGNSIYEQFPNTAYKVGAWQHVAFTYDGTRIFSYVNGELRDQYTVTLNTVDGGTFTIAKGVYSTYQYMQGILSNMQVYSRALSESEIQRNMRSIANPVMEGMILWLPLGATTYDYSGNNRHGARIGGAWVSLRKYEPLEEVL